MRAGLLKGIGEGIRSFAESNGRIVGGIVAVAGVIGTAVLVYQARPKVDKVLAEKKEKIEEIEADEDLTEEEKAAEKKEVTKETAKELLPIAAPAAVCAIVTIGTIVGTLVSDEKQIRGLSSEVIAGSVAYNTLYNKAKEALGEEKAEEIQKEVMQEQVEGKRSNDDVIYLEESMINGDPKGSHLFYDAMTHSWFWSTKTKILLAATKLNGRMGENKAEPYITMGEFFNEIDVPAPPVADHFAWEKGTFSDELYPKMDVIIETSEGSATVLNWLYPPEVRKKTTPGDLM